MDVLKSSLQYIKDVNLAPTMGKAQCWQRRLREEVCDSKVAVCVID